MDTQTKWFLGVLVVVGLVLIWAGSTPRGILPARTKDQSEAGDAKAIEVIFENHIDAKLPEQDVFVEGKTDLSTVVRVEGEEAKSGTMPAKAIYAAKTAVSHDPFKVGSNPLGPFPKGASLEMTLGEWLAASGQGTYTMRGETATLNFSFEKLVPSSVYTAWCSRLKFPPNPSVVDAPCGAPDGTQNIFRSDPAGKGVYILTTEPLKPSTKEEATVIALAYHSDGKTYGPNPGDFGLNSHVQLFFLLPVVGEQAATSTTE